MSELEEYLTSLTLSLLLDDVFPLKFEVREAYLQFMVSIAKLTRDDRNLTQDDDRLWEEMMQVLELETDIANVSLDLEGKGNFLLWKRSM